MSGWLISNVQPFVQGALGLLIGSFLALVSVRLPAGEPMVRTRSKCRSCGRKLSPLELVPVLSWVAQRGRCAGCGARVSPRYPLIELGAAGLGVWAALAAPGWPGLAGAVLAWQLLLIAVIDAEHFWLPDVLTLPLVATGLIAAWLLDPHLLAERAIGAVAGFASLWLVAWIYRRVRGREGLGGGDPRLFAGIGAWIGWIALPTALVWACLAGFAVIAAMLAGGRKAGLSARLPFGTFLAIGAWLAWLLGPLGRGGL